MLLFQRKSDLQDHLKSIQGPLVSIGFVPTMGALHDGHLSLMSQSLAQNTYTVVSIFVNPTQFNNRADLDNYPRNLEQDIALMETISSSLILFAPEISEMYTDDAVAETYDFGGLECQMEGAFRPGHFDGVGTIVYRLFQSVCPTRAYFGEKDFQQLQIIRKLVEQKKLPIEIVACPIFREANGLAMSSRNERLSTHQRAEAALIYKALQEAKDLFKKYPIADIQQQIKTFFSTSSMFQLDYFDIADEETLVPSTTVETGVKYRAFIAVIIDGVRLIDNIPLN
ncbi:MAG: pantoate--beta-alanine ligase [Flavobacterium sp. BFFFF2]|nr:MAG: pantoate--beta-alanine ligase [Flavobacterium sp. BFFFF2]